MQDDNRRRPAAGPDPDPENVPAQDVQEDSAAQEAQEDTIFIMPGVLDPKLTPGGPEFDKEAFDEALNKGYEITRKGLENLRKIAKGTQIRLNDSLTGSINDMTERVKTSLYFLQKMVEMPFYVDLKERIAEFNEYIEEHREEYEQMLLDEVPDNVRDLLPFIQLAIDDTDRELDPAGYTLVEVVLHGFDENWTPLEGKYRQLIDAAMDLARTYKDADTFTKDVETTTTELENVVENLPHIKYKNSLELKTTTDKWMNVFFGPDPPRARGEMNGQINMMLPVRYESLGSKKELTLYYDFKYDDAKLLSLGIPQGFDGYDYFVATVIDNLHEQGNDIVSFSKFLEELGYVEGVERKKITNGRAKKDVSSRPGGANYDQLSKSLIKGMTTTTMINDLDIREGYAKQRSERYREIIAPVFPITIMNERHVASGFVVEGVIKIHDFTPFHYISEYTGHLTKWDKQIMRLYTGKRNTRYWNIMKYLMREIGWMRNPKSKRRNTKLTYSTLYKNTGSKTPPTQQNDRNTLYRILDEVFIPEYITEYRLDEVNTTSPGVILTLNKKSLLPG